MVNANHGKNIPKLRVQSVSATSFLLQLYIPPPRLLAWLSVNVQLPISRRGNRPWMFDLQAALMGQRKAGYVRTYVHSDKKQAARIDFGTDDGNKLWLNGKLEGLSIQPAKPTK